MSVVASIAVDEAAVVSKALLRAAEALGLSSAELSEIVHENRQGEVGRETGPQGGLRLTTVGANRSRGSTAIPTPPRGGEA